MDPVMNLQQIWRDGFTDATIDELLQSSEDEYEDNLSVPVPKKDTVEVKVYLPSTDTQDEKPIQVTFVDEAKEAILDIFSITNKIK